MALGVATCGALTGILSDGSERFATFLPVGTTPESPLTALCSASQPWFTKKKTILLCRMVNDKATERNEKEDTACISPDL